MSARTTTDKKLAQFRLWFFRELNDYQRLALFRLFGIPVDEIRTFSQQGDVMRRFFDGIRMQEQRHAPARERVRHLKRKTTYAIMSRSATIQTDTPLTNNAEVVVYIADADDSMWVRPTSEFNDGRFESAGSDGAQ